MMEINGSDRVRFGPYEVDLHTHELWKHGVKIKLAGQPFEILAVLVSRAGQLVTREELRSQLWPGDTFVDFEHGLNAAVNKLRDALCDSAEDPKYIETLPRRGYRFVAAVERVTPEPVHEKVGVGQGAASTPQAKTTAVPEPIAEVAGAGAAAPVASVPTFETCAPPKHRRWLGYLVSVAVVFSVAVWLVVNELQVYWTPDEKRSAESAATRNVTPLTSLSDPTSEPAFSPDGYRVAFRRDSFVPGSSGIYVKRVGGEELAQLTNDRGDCCPVWSPDGRSLAFSRFSDHERTIYEVPAAGGELHRLFSSGLGPKRGELDWSPDGKSIVFVGEASERRSSIFALSLENSTARPITIPPAFERDWGPSFSPDGERIVFVRSSESSFPENIMVMPAGGGELQRLTAEPTHVLGPPTWSSDGQSIIFGSAHEGSTGLFRIPATGGVSTPIREAGAMAWRPAASRRGYRLAFQQISGGRSIEQLDLSPAKQKARGLVTTLSGENAGPQFSPDGKKLAFQSDRLGGMDIWVSDQDGQNPLQLTAIGTAGTPRWSPDSKSVAFDVGLGRDWREPRAIFVAGADGGTPHPLVQDGFNNPVPSWSRDGAWIYFSSDRSGSWQIWKVRAAGGPPVQVTTQGGFAAWESPDHYVYYAKHQFPGPQLWRIPVEGGPEAPVYPAIRPADWAAWAVVEKGILFVESGVNDAPTLSYLDFTALRVTHLVMLEKTPFWLGATADGKSVAFDQPGSEESHIMLLENFR